MFESVVFFGEVLRERCGRSLVVDVVFWRVSKVLRSNWVWVILHGGSDQRMVHRWSFIRKKSGHMSCPVALPSPSNTPTSMLAAVLFGDEEQRDTFLCVFLFFR